MFCKNCGAEIFASDTYCRECGETVEPKKEEELIETVNLNEEELIETIEAPFIYLPETETKVEPIIPDRLMANNSVKLSFYILLIIVLMFLNTFISYILFDNSETIDNIKKEATKTVIETVTKYKHNFMGYQLAIPTDYIFEEIDGVLYISDKNDTTNIQVIIEKIPYWAIADDKDQLASTFVDEGYMIVTEFREKPYHNKSFFVGELNYNNNNAIVTYTQASETESFQMFINNDNNTYDYTKIEEITSILASASYSSRNIEKDLLIEFPRPNKSEE